ncbi:hypothetical protein ABPG75_003862 [Micractinium tetrahymenae]
MPKQVQIREMAAFAGAASSLTVRQYSDAVLEKYLRGAFAPGDPPANLGQAADALYELLARLRRLSSKQDSEDAKAPLKAIRDAVDACAYNSAGGAESPQVDALFALYARLEEVCEEHMAGKAACGGDRETAAIVQEALRYRLTRLVTGDQWEGSPKLKLRVLKLMFSFMARENEKLLAAGPRTFAPPAAAGAGRGSRLGRSASGRRVALAAPAPCSRWGEAINEMAKMPGARMLPLLKLCLLENLQLSTAAEEAAEAAAAMAAAPSDAASAGPHAPGRASAASDAAGSDGASAKSSAGAAEGPPAGASGVAGAAGGGVNAAPAAPATPARPGRLQEAPPPLVPQAATARAEPTLQAHRRPPSPPPSAQDPRQRSVQLRQQQAQHEAQGQPSPGGALQFSLDELLGLGGEAPGATQQQAVPTRATAAPPSAAATAAATSAEQLFSVFDSLSPGGAAASPPSRSTGSGNPFAPAPAAASAAVHHTRSSPGPEPASPVFGPSSVPGFASFHDPSDPLSGTFAPSSAPTGGRSRSRAGSGSMQGWAAEEEPSPYLGVPNPFTVAQFNDLAPPVLQARRASPQPAAPPPGPPMRSPPSGSRQ